MRQQAFFEPQEVASASGGGLVLPRNASREFLQVHNPSGSAWKYRFGSAPDATSGITLGAGATVTYDVRVPVGDLYIAAGSAFYLIHG